MVLLLADQALCLAVVLSKEVAVESLTPHHSLGAILLTPSRMVLLVVVSLSRGPAPMWFQMNLLLTDDLALEGLHGSLRLARLDALE